MTVKKVLILETSAFIGIPMGGSFFQADYYLRELNKKGYAAEIFVGNIKESFFKKGIKVINKIRKSDFVVGFGTPFLDHILQWLCFFLRKKGVFCIDTIIVPICTVKDYFRRKVLTLKFILWNSIVMISDFLVRLIPTPNCLVNVTSCKYVQEKTSKFSLKRVVRDRFAFPRVSLKASKKTKNSQKVVLFYGRLFRGRGVVDLLWASRILWQKGLNFKLQILGYPVEPLTQKTLESEIKEDEKDKIEIKRKVDDLENYLSRATLVALPFRYPCSFQTPLTLLEPMEFGIPVITTDVGSHGEWIFDGETGFFCERENPESLAKKIEFVFRHPALSSKVGLKGKCLLEKRCLQKDVVLGELIKLENER